jgi:hypothetical protein
VNAVLNEDDCLDVSELLTVLNMEAEITSETSVNFYQTTWRRIQKAVVFITGAVRT